MKDICASVMMATKNVLVILIFSLFTVQARKKCQIQTPNIKGKFQVIGLLSLYSNDIEKFDMFAFLNHLAMQSYSEHSNRREYVLQYTTYDLCNSTELLMEVISNLYLDDQFRLKKNKHESSIVAVIGYMKYDMIKEAMNLFIPMHVPFITYSKNAPRYIGNSVYNWYLPMYEMSIESMHVKRFIEYFNWTYIALISLNADEPKWNFYYEETFSLLKKTLPSLYFVSEKMHEYNKTQMLDIITNIKMRPLLKVIFIWGNGTTQLEFLNLAADQNITDRTWIGHEDLWYHVFNLNKNMLNGLLVIRNEHLRFIILNILFPQRLNIEYNGSPYTQQFTSKYNISMSEHVKHYYVTYLTDTEKRFLTDISRAANIISHQTEFKHRHGVTRIRKELFRSIKKAINIANIDTTKLRAKLTTQKLSLVTKYIDTTNISLSIKWHNQLNKPPIAASTKIVCEPGWEPKIGYLLTNQTTWDLSYGWTCRMCANGLYKPTLGNNTCSKCIKNTISSSNRSHCFDPYCDVYLKSNDTGSIVVLTFNSMGILLTMVILVVFIKFRKTPIVKSSDILPSLVQLIAFLLIFIMLPVTTLAKPTKITCISQPIIFGILTTINIATVLSRTQKILKAFQSNGRLTRRQISLMSAEQYLIVFILIIVDILILIVSFTSKEINIIETIDKQHKVRLKSCNTDTHLHIQVIFTVFLLFACLIQAFRGRNLPEKFNDAKYILYSTFTTCLCYIVLFPLYYSHDDQLGKTIVNWLILTIANCSFLVLLYTQKIYFVLFCPKLNTVIEFRVHMMEKVRNNNSKAKAK